jgi:hypothetical protein
MGAMLTAALVAGPSPFRPSLTHLPRAQISQSSRSKRGSKAPEVYNSYQLSEAEMEEEQGIGGHR